MGGAAGSKRGAGELQESAACNFIVVLPTRRPSYPSNSPHTLRYSAAIQSA